MKINSPHVIFLLFVCGAFGEGEVTKVSVMEGDSVTLNSNLTEINAYRQISWRFGSELIAEISDGKILYKNGSDGSFRDRLQLDSKTGSLTITNMRMKHSSPYELEAINRISGEMTPKKFSISVYESPSGIPAGEVEMKSVSVKTGESLTLQTDVLQPRDELIVWRFGDKGKLIAKADLEAKKNSYDDTDERFRDRLKLDQTGSLTIMNTRITDSGLYIVKISSSKQTLHKRFIVTVRDPGLSSGAIAGIVVVVLVIFAAVAGFIYRRESDLKRQMSKICERLKKLPKICEQLSKISEQLSEICEKLKKISEKDLSEEKKIKVLETCDQLNQLLTVTEQLKKTSEICENGLSEISTELEKLLEGKISEQFLKICEELKRLPDVICDHLNQPPQSEKPDQSLDDSEDLSGDSAEMFRRVSVKEGETARLETGVKNLQNENIMWKFGDKNSPIAEIKDCNNLIIHDNALNGRFKGRLELDEKTGSLSIKNTNTDDSGKYTVWIKNIPNKSTYLIFIVSVSENGASELVTVEMPLLSDEQQSSL